MNRFSWFHDGIGSLLAALLITAIFLFWNRSAHDAITYGILIGVINLFLQFYIRNIKGDSDA